MGKTTHCPRRWDVYNDGMSKRPAIITDRDGTLASVAHVAPQDQSNVSWMQYNAAMAFDAVVPSVLGTLQWARRTMPDVTIIMTSGRAGGDFPGDVRRRRQMEDWILKHQLPIDALLMRKGGDQRRDSIVKREMFEQSIEPHFDVLFAIDDRPQVCELWRDLGVPLPQVTDPGILPPIATQ